MERAVRAHGGGQAVGGARPSGSATGAGGGAGEGRDGAASAHGATGSGDGAVDGPIAGAWASVQTAQPSPEGGGLEAPSAW